MQIQAWHQADTIPGVVSGKRIPDVAQVAYEADERTVLTPCWIRVMRCLPPVGYEEEEPALLRAHSPGGTVLCADEAVRTQQVRSGQDPELEQQIPR
jgi:hypothetical protein